MSFRTIPVGGPRFWFHLLNEFHFLNEKDKPQRLDSIFIFFRLRTCFFKKTRHQSFQHWTITTCREGRWPGAGKNMLPTDYRVFIVGNRQTKCLGGDRQRTVWCLQQHQLCYLHNKRTKFALTVSCRNPGKLCCRSNSPSFCVTITVIENFILKIGQKPKSRPPY